MPRKLARKTNESPAHGTTEHPHKGIPEHNMPSPYPMIFLNWIDPPVGFNTTAIDPSNPYYRVKIMNVGQSGGSSSLEVPFAEPVQWNPLSPSPSIWQFQMFGISPDPNALEYYMTMTVIQGAPGLQQVRSRIFTPPQANHTVPQFVTSASLTDANPAYIQVSGVVNANNVTVSVIYHHVLITDPTIDPHGPRNLFLQQPW
jgi:hypothetical protein